MLGYLLGQVVGQVVGGLLNDAFDIQEKRIIKDRR